MKKPFCQSAAAIHASVIFFLVFFSPGWAGPNILFIFSDDHSWQAISAYNSWLAKTAVTPNLDNLAKKGMMFKRCYVTNAICGPSRAVVQTGKYSHINGFTDNHTTFDGNQQTFPKIMRQHGYQTAVIGKWHLVSQPQGFDYWDVMDGQGEYYNPKMTRGDANGQAAANAVRHVTGYNSDIVANLTIDWLSKTRNKAKPFMVMMQFKATHRGWAPGPGDYGLFDTVTIPLAPNLFDTYTYRGSAARLQDMSIRYSMLERDVKLADPEGLGVLDTAQRAVWNAYYKNIPIEYAYLGYTWADKAHNQQFLWKYRQYLENYLATAVGLDRAIGRVLNYLDDNNLADSTIVIYSSDQGFYLGEHGWFDKRFMYEQSLRTPLIVRWPGVVAPGTVNAVDIVSNVDFAETFLDIAGITRPNDMQGRSLVPIFKGNTPADWRKSFYYQYFEGYENTHRVYDHYGVTDGRYKLIRFEDNGMVEWEFYDLKRDPDEMVNQYYIPENDSIITAMRAELVRLRQELAAGSGPDATSDNWRYEKQTLQLPLRGCMDTRYVEYDPEADTPDTSACVTMRAAVRDSKDMPIAGTRVFRYRVVDGAVIFSFSPGEKPSFLSIHTLSGVRIKQMTPGTSGVWVWRTENMPKGMYLVKTGNGKITRVLKVLL